jgi:hypothetical protein
MKTVPDSNTSSTMLNSAKLIHDVAAIIGVRVDGCTSYSAAVQGRKRGGAAPICQELAPATMIVVIARQSIEAPDSVRLELRPDTSVAHLRLRVLRRRLRVGLDTGRGAARRRQDQLNHDERKRNC